MSKKLIGNNWDEILKPIFESKEYAELRDFLIGEINTRTIYPNMNNIYNALKFTPPENVKCVILGQDPYIGPNQAHGLAFSVQPPEPPPPSLVNIFKEISSDLGVDFTPKDGNLIPWTEEGVLLLNSVLTVRAGQSNSHKSKGWEQLTSAVIKYLVHNDKPMVFLLWGRNAQDVYAAATADTPAGSNKLILKAAHPSPFSAYSGFFGCKHFSKTNEFLTKNNIKSINWIIT